MEKLKEQMEEWAEKINALSLRERAMMMGVFIIAVGGLWYQFYLVPWEAQVAKLGGTMEQQLVERDAYLQAQEVYRIEAGVDPDEARRSLLNQLLERRGKLEARQEQNMKDMISPVRMVAVLENVLDRQSGLHLVSLEALPAIDLTSTPTADGEEEEAGAGPAIYKHRLELRFSGAYLDVLRFVAELEAQDWVVFWDSFEYVVGEYPETLVTIRLFTLSPNAQWIGV